ncbi:4'-phosphopantetheinyl transferase family protein [Rhizobium sp. YIM 134829]|uniref:4'-phosphopantetheinyl transferase family protein n=1 Tax=Rhizobium sp. YIM 134829 TaxID=3390453 RepID=UPI00397A46B3
MSVPASTADHRFGAARLHRLWQQAAGEWQAPARGCVLAIVAAVDREAEAWTGLSSDEQQALARLRRADDRAAYAMAHGLAREAFARLTGEASDRMRLSYHSAGRPVLVNHEHLTLSLSHARAVVAVAIGWDVRVGIDVEPLTGSAPDAGTLELALTTEEQAMLAALSTPAASEQSFLQLWTAKEAILKAHGLGLPAGLQRISLAKGFDRPSIDLPGADRLDLDIAGFVHGGAVCTLAVEAGVRRLIVENRPVP